MRLTNDNRDDIVRRAIAKKFEKQEKDLVKQEQALAIKAYNSLFDAATRRKIKALDAKWFYFDTCLKFNCNGQTHFLRVDSSEKVPVPNRGYGCQNLGALPGPMAEEVIAFGNLKEDIRTQKRELEVKLKGLLYSITTLKRLQELWPEGREFYKSFEGFDTKPGLPAIIFDDINKMLDIEKKAA